MTTNAVYVYGIIPGDNRVVFDEAGMDDDHDEVYTVPWSGLSAVVSLTPVDSFHGMKRDEAARYLVAHQRIVETVMQHFTVLPVKFGTVLPDEASVQRLLRQGATPFRSALERCTGLTQMEVIALWNLPEVFQSLGQDPRLAELRARMAGKPADQTLEERVQAGQLVKMLLEERRNGMQADILPRLEAIAQDHVVNPTMDDSMVTNIGLLIDQRGRDVLDKTLAELDAAFGGRLTFRCVGPLPPYSFATVEVNIPPPAAIDAACRELQLGEAATLNDIKRAYYQAASAVHPDLNRDGKDSEARMTALTQGYRLLTAVAESQIAAAAGEGGPGSDTLCQFHPQAVRDTLLVSVRRQEIAPHSGQRVM